MSNRLFASSRGRIMQLLRRARQTVNELAAALGLTDNAIRANLARREQDGLVRQAGTRPSFRKPESEYDITPEAERLFARAYAPMLGTLLDVLEARLSERELDAHLRELGRRLAAPHVKTLEGLSPAQRARRTLKVLEELGGLAELEERDGRFSIRGFGCPFSQVVAAHPKLCLVAEVLVGELLGQPVHEQCERGDGRARCCFVAADDDGDDDARRAGRPRV
jgi:predicted ArsR family transcriptional regulator